MILLLSLSEISRFSEYQMKGNTRAYSKRHRIEYLMLGLTASLLADRVITQNTPWPWGNQQKIFSTFSVLLPHNWIVSSQRHCTLHHVRTFAKTIVWILASFVEENKILLFRLTSYLLAVRGCYLAIRMFGPVIATSPTRVTLYPKYQTLSGFFFSLIQSSGHRLP